MKILYIYGNCSRTKYEALFKHSNAMVLQQAQKYHDLLTEGLRDNGVEVSCMSGLPINRSVVDKIFLRHEHEFINNIHYYYYASINLPVLRQLSLFLGAFFNTFRHCMQAPGGAVVCDFLNVSNASGALLAAKLCRRKSICIVTDIPGFMSEDGGHSHHRSNLKLLISNKIYQFILFRFDAYVCLTQFMNDVINKKRRPHIVMEGHVDKNMITFENSLEEKHSRKIILYAGSIKKIYGIETLVQAFINLQDGDAELHIYGDGDYASELTKLGEENPGLRYLGVKPNRFIVMEEMKATLLVNPRPTAPTYTKFSFPSKNMEYMASGTPLLTTRLPGMPSDYCDHVYLIEDETVPGLTQVLRDVLYRPRPELHEKGMKAKEFVLREKNNVVQSAKIIRLIESLP